MQQWLCGKGYVAAGINYTLRDEAHLETSVYSQFMEVNNPDASIRGIKQAAMQASGYVTLAAVAKCLRAVTWLVARGNQGEYADCNCRSGKTGISH